MSLARMSAHSTSHPGMNLYHTESARLRLSVCVFVRVCLYMCVCVCVCVCMNVVVRVSKMRSVIR